MTYSIVARDPSTGRLGVAVQSHYFSVGAIVPWARPGVGAVATQSVARADYGPRGLELMAGGASAADALAALAGEDPGAATRQVAMIDSSGAVACHTGAACIPCAGDAQGDGVSCQANLMASDTVWDAMLEAFMWESGPLARRMLAALFAAEQEGGDLRGRQSSALLVVPGEGEPWEQVVSLRVEDDPEPLDELARLLDVHEAYALAGSVADAGADPAGARDALARALEILPDDAELRFWEALAMARAGDEEGALVRLRALGPRWHELLGRLPDDVAPGARALADRL